MAPTTTEKMSRSEQLLALIRYHEARIEEHKAELRQIEDERRAATMANNWQAVRA